MRQTTVTVALAVALLAAGMILADRQGPRAEEVAARRYVVHIGNLH